MAKKKAEDMRAQLKSIIIMSRGMGAWDELLKTEGEIRKKRQAAIYAQKEKQRKFMEWTAITIGVAIFGSFLFLVTDSRTKRHKDYFEKKIITGSLQQFHLLHAFFYLQY